jgi:hypothetical protein
MGSYELNTKKQHVEESYAGIWCDLGNTNGLGLE